MHEDVGVGCTNTLFFEITDILRETREIWKVNIPLVSDVLTAQKQVHSVNKLTDISHKITPILSR